MPENAPNRDQLYALAVQSAKSGQRRGAVLMFRQILAEDPDNVSVMLWLARLSTTPEKRKNYLQQVIALDPDNATAKKALTKMGQRHTARRNQNLLRFGSAAYVIVLLMAAIFIILQLASLPPV